jgi:hypothetical protein
MDPTKQKTTKTGNMDHTKQKTTKTGNTDPTKQKTTKTGNTDPTKQKTTKTGNTDPTKSLADCLIITICHQFLSNRHDITEIMLKVALNTIKPTKYMLFNFIGMVLPSLDCSV